VASELHVKLAASWEVIEVTALLVHELNVVDSAFVHRLADRLVEKALTLQRLCRQSNQSDAKE